MTGRSYHYSENVKAYMNDTDYYICVFLDPVRGSGCDVFADVPSEEEEEADIADIDLIFCISERPLLPVYNLRLHQDKGWVPV